MGFRSKKNKNLFLKKWKNLNKNRQKSKIFLKFNGKIIVFWKILSFLKKGFYELYEHKILQKWRFGSKSMGLSIGKPKIWTTKMQSTRMILLKSAFLDQIRSEPVKMKKCKNFRWFCQKKILVKIDSIVIQKCLNWWAEALHITSGIKYLSICSQIGIQRHSMFHFLKVIKI